MIKTDRQLQAAREKLVQVQEAAEAASGAQRAVLRDFSEELNREIVEYETLRKGEMPVIQINGLDDLPDALVKARVARGLTQEKLAKALGVKEQQVQRDEAGGYERATLARLVDVASALGFRLVGNLELVPQTSAPMTADQLLSPLIDTLGDPSQRAANGHHGR
ncbi:multiprotein-bridging factor 1 family protein [Streptomyces sp. NPDC058612]|uniref:helix-turn-helix domain-containing protein n=1 Tax=Streptomyces sp. NPDC058612 TaxID=3346555 RepID=UPI0036658468